MKFKVIENASITAWFEHIKVRHIVDLMPGNKVVTQELPRIVPTSGREIVKQGAGSGRRDGDVTRSDAVVVGQGSSPEPRTRSSSCDSVPSNYSAGYAISESSEESQPDPAEFHRDMKSTESSGVKPATEQPRDSSSSARPSSKSSSNKNKNK